MLDRTRPVEDVPLGRLVSRAADDAKRFVRAEVAVQVATVKVKLAGAKIAGVFFGIAFLLVIAAVTVLVFALGDLLARWLGPAGGHAVAALIALVVAGLLGWFGARRLSPPAGSPLGTQ